LGTLLDEADPARHEALNRLVSVIEFEDEVERYGYIAREMAFGTDLKREPLAGT
jgi:hypothetical protein